MSAPLSSPFDVSKVRSARLSWYLDRSTVRLNLTFGKRFVKAAISPVLADLAWKQKKKS